MEMVKIKDVKTGAIKEVRKSLASDYIGTGRFELLKEDSKKTSKFTVSKEDNDSKRFN